MKLAALVTGTLLTSLILTACGSGNVTVAGVKPEQVRTSATRQTPKAEALTPIKLEPISPETVKELGQLRQKPSLRPVASTEVVDADEAAEVERLIAEAEAKIAEEDRTRADGNFAVKSAGPLPKDAEAKKRGSKAADHGEHFLLRSTESAVHAPSSLLPAADFTDALSTSSPQNAAPAIASSHSSTDVFATA